MSRFQRACSASLNFFPLDAFPKQYCLKAVLAVLLINAGPVPDSGTVLGGPVLPTVFSGSRFGNCLSGSPFGNSVPDSGTDFGLSCSRFVNLLLIKDAAPVWGAASDCGPSPGRSCMHWRASSFAP